MTLPIPRLSSIFFALALSAALLAQTPTELMSQGQTAYNQKEYAKSAELYLKAHRAKPNLIALYNAACSYALAGDKERAVAALEEAAKLGYNNADHLKTDTDLASLHNDSRWPKLVAAVEENEKKNPVKRWKKPYTVLPAPKEVGDLATRLNRGTSAVWLDGDTLSFLYKGDGPSVFLAGGVQEPMDRIPDSDLWITQVRMEGWDKAFVSYGFLVGTSNSTGKLQVWRGRNAPALPEEAKELKGQVIERTYASPAMGEDRKLFIYLPPNAPKKDLPAFFLADGLACRSYAQVLEPLILAGRVRPCAIVGVDNGGYRGDRTKPFDVAMDYRAKEYVNGQDPAWFDKHLKFFTEEVPAYVAKEFGVSTRPEDRAIMGCSNGGAFAATVAYRRPGLFSAALPFSLGVPPDVPLPGWPPRMFFAAGTLESFSLRTQAVYEAVKPALPNARYDLYTAGHDPTMWQLAFARFAPEVFPPKR